MTAPQPTYDWGHATVEAPMALGLGAPSRNPAAARRLGQPEPVAEPSRTDPRAVRLPVASSDQEGIYEGLQWAVRALEECGRAFTRLASRTSKVEARVAAVERAIAARTALDQPAPVPDPDMTRQLTALDERLRRLETVGLEPPPSPAPVVPLRIESQVITLRKEMVATKARLAILESRPESVAPRVPSPVPSPVISPAPEGLAARVGSLEADILGLYRELDAVAELVADRFATVADRIDRIVVARPEPVPVEDVPPPRDERHNGSSPMQVAPSIDDESSTVRAKAASVLIGELERICHALGVLADVTDRAE